MNCSKCGTPNDHNNDCCINCGELLYKNTAYNIHKNNDFETQQNENQSISNKPTKACIISFVLGIISIITSLISLISIPLGILGLILGINTKVKSSFRKAVIILSIIGLSLSVIFIVVKPAPNLKTFSGDGFYLSYNEDWSTITLPNGREALKYNNEESFLIPVGNSALSDAISNFDTASGQTQLYNMFYNYWNNPSNNSAKIYSASNGFNKLNDSIYYATYNYGTSSSNIRGKYILLVSTEQNIILSFMTNASKNVFDNDARAVKLLETIRIYKNFQIKEDNSDEDEISDILSYWNIYSKLRQGTLGKVKNINGGWRILSDSETYWKFENGQFWWYKSFNDLNDNYWYGTTQILTGKEGFSLAGIDENKLDQIVYNSYGKFTENDVYTIICTPTKIISNGIDKSSTNIPTGTTWSYIWILIDHGTEGIEAQILNTKTYDSSYYVKIKD